MVKRRQLSFKPLDSGRQDQPVLRAVGQDEDTLPSVCISLHHARLRAGYELTDVAKALRIQLSHLQALEDGRFENLPGETYAVGFLKSYGGFLGLDTEDLVSRYKTETGIQTAKQRLEFPVPSKESRMPRPWLVLLALALAGLAYGGWQYYSTDGQIATDIVADVSDKFTEPAVVEAPETTAAAPETTAPTTAPTTTPTTTPNTVASVVEEALPEDPAPEVAAAESENVEADVGGLSANLLTDERASEAPPVVEEVAAVGEAVSTPEISTSVPETNLVSESDGEAGVRLPSTLDETMTSGLDAERPLVMADEDYQAARESFSTANVSAEPAFDEQIRVSQPDFAAPGQTAPEQTVPDQAALDLAAPDQAAPDLMAGLAEVPAPRATQPTWFEPRIDYQFAPVEPSSTATEIETAYVPATSAEPSSGQFSVAYVPRVYGRTDRSGRVTITATADSWVQVQGPGSELLLTRILRTGDSYNVPNRSDLIMVTGNAGALEIRVDGSLVDPVGPVGVVRRNVALDPGRLLDGTAVEN